MFQVPPKMDDFRKQAVSQNRPILWEEHLGLLWDVSRYRFAMLAAILKSNRESPSAVKFLGMSIQATVTHSYYLKRLENLYSTLILL